MSEGKSSFSERALLYEAPISDDQSEKATASAEFLASSYSGGRSKFSKNFLIISFRSLVIVYVIVYNDSQCVVTIT